MYSASYMFSFQVLSKLCRQPIIIYIPEREVISINLGGAKPIHVENGYRYYTFDPNM